MINIEVAPLLGHDRFGEVAASSLAARGLTDIPFLAPTWVEAYARARLSGPEPERTSVATVTDSSGTTCVPFSTHSTSLHMAPQRWTDYSDVYSSCTQLDDAARHVQVVLNMASSFNTRELYPTGLMADLVPALARTSRSAQLGYARHYVRTLSPGVGHEVGRLIGRGTWEKKQRRSRRLGYRLVRRESAEITVDHLAGFAGLHQRRWNHAGYPSIFADEAFRLFTEDLTHTCESLVLYTLENRDGTALAYRLGMSTPQTYFDWLTTFDVERSSESLGLLLLAAVMDAEADRGTAAINFLRGSERYKGELADTSLLVPSVRLRSS